MGGEHDQVTNELLALYGYRSALDGGVLFCGVSEHQFAINGRRYQWPKGAKLTWSLGFSRLGSITDLDLKQANIDGFKEISSVCQLDFEYTANARTANILVTLHRLDGKGGVLADMQVPVGNVSTATTQLLGRVDDSESWTIAANPPANVIDYYRVQLHENLHAVGLGHQPANAAVPALIAPTYSRTVRHLQQPDIDELQIRYGKREARPEPVPTPVPALGESLGVNLIIGADNSIELTYTRVDGTNTVKYTAKGTAKKS